MYTNTVGITRGIPLEWTEDEIIENSVSSSRIIKVERMNFWDAVNKEAHPIRSIKVTFRSYKLPTEMKIYNVLIKLEIFVPRPLFGRNCCRYGHTVKFCKTPQICQRCMSCRLNTSKIVVVSLNVHIVK